MKPREIKGLINNAMILGAKLMTDIDEVEGVSLHMRQYLYDNGYKRCNAKDVDDLETGAVTIYKTIQVLS